MIWIAWVELGPNQTHTKPPIVHEQGDYGRTRCGIEMGFHWTLERMNYSIVNCKRCLKSKAAEEAVSE